MNCLCNHLAHRRQVLAGGAALAASTALSGCFATNPATGERSFVGSMDEKSEIQAGAEYHPQVLNEFGGEYDNARVRGYVRDLGMTMASKSERPSLKWTFTVLNSDIVNAFAVPGGYVYITRGTLALADTEAEMAGVIGHEIGHVTALHTPQRFGKQQAAGILTTLGAIGVGILTGSGQAAQMAGDIGQTLSGSLLASYSREHEMEADRLGVRYLARNGWEPFGVAKFLEKLGNDTRLQAIMAGKDPAIVEQTHMMSTHPRTSDRVNALSGAARAASAPNQKVNKDEYLRAIDGITYGDDPAQGIVKGTRFVHPDLRFAFDAPEGFKLVNTPSAVQGQGRNALMIFGLDPKGKGVEPQRYLAANRMAALEPMNVNGLPAATGLAQGQVGNTAADIRVVAIADGDKMYRFQFAVPRGGM
ncbi:MAG: M48 family metalloprotease, partial [Alphaproteobacteria bacterium]|nr:M48 family metalloprotease [Alphaproteobacteria bacterium]